MLIANFLKKDMLQITNCTFLTVTMFSSIQNDLSHYSVQKYEGKLAKK